MQNYLFANISRMITKNTLLQFELIKLFLPILDCFPAWLLYKSNFGGCSTRDCGKLKRMLPEICDCRPRKAAPLETGKNYESKVASRGNHFALSAAFRMHPRRAACQLYQRHCIFILFFGLQY